MYIKNNCKKSYFSVIRRKIKFLLIVLSITCFSDKYEEKYTYVLSGDTLVNQNIIIKENESCLIKPGTIVRFDGYYLLYVRGILVCNGTKDSVVVITRNGRALGANKFWPQWAGIEISGKNANAVFSYTRIEGAYRNIMLNTKPVFANCTFSGNRYALYCGSNSTVIVDSCKFYNNTFGLYGEHCKILLNNSVIVNNNIGINMLMYVNLLSGNNIIKDNKQQDIMNIGSMGNNYESVVIRQMWNMLNELY